MATTISVSQISSALQNIFSNFGGGTIGSNDPNALDLNPVLPVVRRALSDMNIVDTLKAGTRMLDSNAFHNICAVSVKTVPYAFGGHTAIVQRFDNPISARLRYLEAGLTGLVSFVYNFVFSTVFGVLNLVTFNQVKTLSDLWKKHFCNTGLAVVSTGLALVGTVAPGAAVKLNGVALLGVGALSLMMMQSDFSKNISQVYNRYRGEFQTTLQEGLRGNPEAYTREVVPFMQFLDRELSEDRVFGFKDLLELFGAAVRRLPNVPMRVSVETIKDNLRGIFEDALSPATSRA